MWRGVRFARHHFRFITFLSSTNAPMEPVHARAKDRLSSQVLPTKSFANASVSATTSVAKQVALAVCMCAVWTIGVVGVSALSSRYAHSNVWYNVQKSGDDQFWWVLFPIIACLDKGTSTHDVKLCHSQVYDVRCEYDQKDMLIREPSNSWSDFGFLAVGMCSVVNHSTSRWVHTNNKRADTYCLGRIDDDIRWTKWHLLER
jgi:hypothetical protein